MNILMILTDQQRFDALGCNGNPLIRTPHMDALARRGVRFSHAFTGIVPCSPSRACLFTGRFGHINGVVDNDAELVPGLPNLATELGGANYQLGYAGKWHVDPVRNPSDFGFSGRDFRGYGYPWDNATVAGSSFTGGEIFPENVAHYREYLERRGLPAPRIERHFKNKVTGSSIYGLQTGTIEQSFEAMVAEDTIDLLRTFSAERKVSGKPFFVWGNFFGPHRPMVVPEPYFSMYDPASVPFDPAYAETFANKPVAHRVFSEKSADLGEDESWGTWQRIIASYWGCTTMLDDLLGRILAALDELGETENTMIVFGTDHGDMMGAHRQFEKGPSCYEEAYRIPLIVAHPHCRTPGAVNDDFVYLHDLYPSILEAAGVALPVVPDHRSLLPMCLNAGASNGRDHLYTQFYRQIVTIDQRMIRTRTHKYVFNRRDVDELYDLAADPHEMTNRHADPAYAAIEAELMHKLVAAMTELKDPLLPDFLAERPGTAGP